MRKLNHKCSLIAAISLDGKISDNSNRLPDWTSKEDWKWFQGMLSKCDLVIAGRKTYELAKRHMDRRNVLVFSRRRTKSILPNVAFVNPESSDIKRIIKKYRNIAVVGGAGVYSYFLNKRLATDMYLTIEPVFLGKGVVLFEDGIFTRTTARLKSKRALNRKGSILLHYEL